MMINFVGVYLCYNKKLGKKKEPRFSLQEIKDQYFRSEIKKKKKQKNTCTWSNMNDQLSEGTYFLAILQDVLLGANAGFGPWWIWLPLPILHVHVHVQFAAEHGNLRFRQQAGIAVSGHLKKK